MGRAVLAIFAVFAVAGCATTKRTVRATTLDVGTGIGVDARYDVTPYVGASIPLGPLSLSGGMWSTLQGVYGPYMGIGWSWAPFAEQEDTNDHH